jgi:LPXTG-site transpeptidase (sortase) family protein
VLVVPIAAGIVALAACGGSSSEAAPAATATTTATANFGAGSPISTSSTAAPPPPPSTSNPVPSGPASTAPTTSLAPPTTTTIAPIVTHDARVGIGVLTTTAVNAPVRVEVPSIGANGPVLAGGVDATGGLEIPGDAKDLVWWKFGPTPGDAGSAVIAGHVDWKHVLGVFNRLDEAKRGDPITVTYADGTTRRFVVDTVELVDKPAVAVNDTFARDGAPVLRLVTCGGEFDHSVHHYESNVVVTAYPM